MKGDLRHQIIEAVDIAVAGKARLFKACETIKLCPRRLRRWRKAEEDGRKGGYRALSQRFSEPEKDAIIEALSLPGMASLSLKVAHATLMDQGIYVGSPSTFARVVVERGLRTNRWVGKANNAKRPELVATGPGQVWC